ncbi:BlaI/MecI/CopY family transcriptional regulator [Streptomyces sp. NPDC006393]|uniref:BlaI/MecI/CopY family transcriptional regulator n=1 Tax=Streptomyces sp. NPDC006393 TaxID=3156763 RepID=UPI0033C3CF72
MVGVVPRPLGELEDAVMTRVWKWNRPVTVREVLEDLQKERSIAYTTVMTVLDNLHQKGWVRREAEGRAYRYEAVSTRAAYAAALMNDAWSQSDNPAAALVAFFGMMSDEQRRSLRDALRVVEGGTEGTAEEPRAGSSAEPGEETGEEASAREPEVVGEVPDTAEAAAFPETSPPAESADAPETGDQNPGSAQGGRGR